MGECCVKCHRGFPALAFSISVDRSHGNKFPKKIIKRLECLFVASSCRCLADLIIPLCD